MLDLLKETTYNVLRTIQHKTWLGVTIKELKAIQADAAWLITIGDFLTPNKHTRVRIKLTNNTILLEIYNFTTLNQYYIDLTYANITKEINKIIEEDSLLDLNSISKTN